jgi:hypothetical protein
LLGSKGEVRELIDVETADDAEAIELGTLLAAGRGFEIWRGHRRVYSSPVEG